MNTSSENEIVVNPETAAGRNPEYSSYWGKDPARDAEYNASTRTAATASTTTSYPEHSEFYASQPGMMSEADEIRKKKEEEENKGNGGAIGGAAAVAGIAGLMLVGPIVGVAAAGAGAYVAATNKGAAGSALRASGTAASAVGSSAHNFNKKHQVLSKTGRGIATGVGWVSGKLNRKSRRSSSNPQAAEANLTSC